MQYALGTITAGNYIFLNNNVLYPYSLSQWSRLFKGDHIHINFLTFFFDLTEPADQYLCRRSIWRMDTRSFQGTILRLALCYLRHYVTTWWFKCFLLLFLSIIWLTVIIAQWLKCFVHIYCIKFLKIHFSQKVHILLHFWFIHFLNIMLSKLIK